MSIEIAGKKVGRIGFGLMGIPLRKPPMSDADAFATIKTAIDSGCNYFNGGEFYGTPENNSLTLLNKYFAKYPEDAAKVVLNIKGCINMAIFAPDGCEANVRNSIDNCLAMLGPNGHIDQFEPARKDPNVDFEDVTLKTIDEYVKAGKIGAISVSEVNANTIRSAAKKYKIASVEIELSLFALHTLKDGTLEACAENGIIVLAYSPLGKGFLSGQIKSRKDIPEGDWRHMAPQFAEEHFSKNLVLVEKVEALAKKKNCTPGQIAIGWVLALNKRPGMPTIIPIPGSSNPARVRENATIIDLSDEDLKEIDEILKGFVRSGGRYSAQQEKYLSL